MGTTPSSGQTNGSNTATADTSCSRWSPNERAAFPFHELVRRRVCGPAGMHDSEFLRSDELPGRTALGYLTIDGVWRTNVFHLPVRGSGDGGIYSTAADISVFWRTLFARRIVSGDLVTELIRPRS